VLRTGLVALALSACGRAPPEPSPSPPPSASATLSPAALRVTVDRADERVRFSLQNTGSSPVSLEAFAAIDRRWPDGVWEVLGSIDVGGYRLVEACDQKPGSCVTIEPGKTLRPIGWTGFSCAAQCNQSCRANTWMGPGTYRLVLKGCGGGAKILGPEFTLPEEPPVK
jgi:hypothetical protein